jgi:hypothetical protein
MLRNLNAEMVRNDITCEQIAMAINRTTQNTRKKIREESIFSISEAMAIRDKFFSNLDFEYLFKSEKKQSA